ncbi:MAG: hypothetical protein JNJ91_13280 [Flavobacteriales bacterium]|nr:hypothetical protein [Flavobacteriales bacterium]
MSVTTQRIDTTVMQRLLTTQPLLQAEAVYGTLGKDRVKFMLRFLKVLGHTSRVDRSTRLTVFSILDADATLDEERLRRAERFRQGEMLRGLVQTETVEIRSDGTAFIWSGDVADILERHVKIIVYKLVQEVEEIWIGTECIPVEKFLPGASSQFILHHFDTIREAILHYREHLARASTCLLLREAWQDRDKRFWFAPKPEFRLRNSLCQFLRSSTRFDDYWVRPEQFVDETDPVDIKVTSQMSTREALIEVKWIGKSRSKDGKRWTSNHGESRAQSGAKQLAEYLDKHKRNSPASDTLGYLVVFDCRRDGLTVGTTSITSAQAEHYRTREVTYNPEYHVTRTDFEKPIRIFLEA